MGLKRDLELRCSKQLKTIKELSLWYVRFLLRSVTWGFYAASSLFEISLVSDSIAKLRVQIFSKIKSNGQLCY